MSWQLLLSKKNWGINKHEKCRCNNVRGTSKGERMADKSVQDVTE
jgi:hypothetical protein